VGKEFSERGPNFFNYVQYLPTVSNTFSRRAKEILGGFGPLVTGLLGIEEKKNNNMFPFKKTKNSE